MKCQLIVLVLMISAATALKWGRCPQVSVQPNFSVRRYMGTWFEFERYNVLFERGVKCGRADYRQTSATTVSVKNSGTKSDGTKNEAIGEATIPDPSQPAKLRVKFPGYSFFAEGNYWVFATDYTNYSVVYSCSDFYIFHVDVLWVLSRSRRGLPDRVRDSLHNRLTSAGLDASKLVRQTQTGCVN